MPTPLLDRIKQGQRREISVRYLHPTEPVRMSPFLRRLYEKRLPVKALYNGAWTEPDQGGAA